jgi:hypothetical protein
MFRLPPKNSESISDRLLEDWFDPKRLNEDYSDGMARHPIRRFDSSQAPKQVLSYAR